VVRKVLLFKFQHETNSLCPVLANLDRYKESTFVLGEDILKGPRAPGLDITGALDVIEQYPDIEIIPTVSMFANPSGPVTGEVFDFVVARTEEAIREKGAFDGVMILFHGAMAAQGHPDAEGDLLEILREKLGWDVPIVASLDLHANVTEKMARCATALVPYEHYPHIDAYATAQVAARILVDAMDGRIRPVMAFRKIPHLLPLFPTERAEIRPLYDTAEALQSKSGMLCVRFTHGFFASDIEELGMAVLAIADGDREAAERAADELRAVIEREKDKIFEEYPTLDEALDLALQPADKPLVIADTSDNPGGGGMGNTTHILRRILERGMSGCALAILVDPVSVLACERAGVGATVELQLGGWSDPVYSGGPLSVTAYVCGLTDGYYTAKGVMSHGKRYCMGKTAVLEIGGNYVIVTSLPVQPFDLEVFRAHGITPEEQRLLVAKSSIHYRASFGTIARAMIPVPMPGYNVPYPQGFPFRVWKGKG